MRTIVLLGLRGAGKSSVARELARALGREAVDTDDLVAERARKSIARTFAEDGEARFRELEAEALRDALARRSIVAPGGGAVTRPENREAIRDSGALVVYLRARPETLAARVEADAASAATRPALAPGGPLAEARALLAAREAHYLGLAQLVVETDGLTVSEVAGRVLAHVQL